MKKIYALILLSLFFSKIHSQVSFWYENFGNGCNQGQVANTIATPSNGAWSVSSHTLPFLNGPEANEWFISSSEQGQAVGICGGITCGGSNNRTLHIGRNKPIPPPGVVDVGASYFGGPGSYTNKRVESPVIDCSGKNFIQLSFTYILGGVPNNDFCDIECSADGGVTWTLVTTVAQSNNTGCSPQGKWSFFATGLPTALANNSNVKIGFHWYNNDPTGGSPSVAIDEIHLSELTMITSSTVGCVAAASTASIANIANGNSSYTWAATPNTVTFTPNTGTTTALQFPGVGTYSVYAYGSASVGGAATATAMTIVNVIFGSTSMVSAVTSDSILCTGNNAVLTASGATSYSWNTSATTSTLSISPSSTTVYTVTGTTGYCISTFTIQQTVDPCTGLTAHSLRTENAVYPNPFDSELHVFVNSETEMVIVNILGKELKREKIKGEKAINTNEFPKGIYFVELISGDGKKTLKLLKN